MRAVPGWPVAFRGSTAVTAGMVTKNELRGPRFIRLFPDTYVAVRDEPPDLELRSHAAYRYVEGRGVLAGYSAAELLGASCGSRDAPAEIVAPSGHRNQPGLLVRRERLTPDDVMDVRGIRTTTPVRTAFDLARRGGLVERVVAVDALARRHRFAPDQLLHLTVRYRGARGVDRIPEVLAHADRRSGSPMETRLRMVIVQGGLPRPEAQWVVQDPRTRTAVWLDLAYPERRIAIEYEGGGHADADAVLRDVGRYTALVDKGWRVYRYTKFDVLRNPDKIVDDLARALRTTST